MKYIFIFYSFIITGVVQAQLAPEVEWQKTIGGSKDELNPYIINSPDGGYLICCSSESNISGDKTENRKGGFDYWILKLNAGGNIEWQKTIGGSGNDYIAAVELTPDNGYILGGYSQSGISGDKAEGKSGYCDFWIIKLDSSGSIEWQNTIQGDGADILTITIVTSDNGYLFGGSSNSGVFLDKTSPNYGNEDYWLVKLNSLGEIEWEKSYGGSGDESVTSIYETAENEFIVVGNSNSDISGIKSENNLGTSGTNDIWVIKIDADGELIWQNTIGGESSDIANKVLPATDGGYLLGGFSYSSESYDITDTNNGTADFLLIQIDAFGDVVGDNLIGGNYSDWITSMEYIDENYILVSGFSSSGISGDKSEANVGLEDYWVVAIDVDANIVWEKTFGGNSGDIIYSAYITEDAGIVLCGKSNSGASGDKTDEAIGEYDIWLLNLYPFESACLLPPVDLYADFISPSSAKLHWSIDSGAIKYKVQYRKTTEATWTNTSATSNVKNLFFLAPSTTYKYRVRSLCGPDLTSNWSTTENFTTTPLRISDRATDQSSLAVYPNPNNGIFTIEITSFQGGEDVSVSIVNMMGEEFYKEKIYVDKIVNHNIILNSTIENGIYFIKIKSENTIITDQIVISK